MDRTATIHKMEEYIQDFREQLEKNDPASLAVLAANTKYFFAGLLQDTQDGSCMEDSIKAFTGCIDRFEKSCSIDDRQTAAKQLAEMETIVRDMLKKSAS